MADSHKSLKTKTLCKNCTCFCGKEKKSDFFLFWFDKNNETDSKKKLRKETESKMMGIGKATILKMTTTQNEIFKSKSEIVVLRWIKSMR